MKLNSVIFHTSRLVEVRSFYENVLKMKVGTYLKDGHKVPDCSEKYINYDISGALLCFEIDGDRTDVGTVVLNVENFLELREQLEKAGIKIHGGNAHYFKIKDPEGRSLIIEPIK